MEASKQTYSKISDCGSYGFKPYGPWTDGGELWAWINTPDAMCVMEGLYHPDDMETAIDEFKEEMQMLTDELMREVNA